MSLVDRAKNILMTPKTEWDVIANEEANASSILTGYVLPLSLIGSVATFVGTGLLFRSSSSMVFAAGMAVISLIATIAGTYIAAFVVDALAGSFGSEKNFDRSMQLVAYSSTPGWVAGILNLLPFGSLLVFIALFYNVYLMYLGFGPVKKTPQDKVVVYMIVAIVAYVIATMVLAAILGGILVAVVGIGVIGARGL